MKTAATLFFAFAFICNAYSNTWNIGPTRTYTLPSQVKNLVQNGDTIYLDESTYVNDATKWTKNNLSFIGLGSGAVLQYTGDIPNGKGIWVFESPGSSDDAYIENIIFDGAQVSDNDGGNGAGIRFQAKNLTINHCKFMNCQNGILEGHGSVTTSNVSIRNCEFQNNGYQLQDDPQYSGYEHNIYISASTEVLFVVNCYFHHPRGQGNSLKTRAQQSYILYNLIDEEDSGYGSWELNIAQGGLNVIMGNVIIQGTSGANHGIISYDAAINVLEDFYFVNNTVINKYGGNARFFNISPASGINTFKLYNNIFASVPGASNTLFSGNIPTILDTSHNVWINDFQSAGFTDPDTDDYSLTEDAISMINKGTGAGLTNTNYSLKPVKMYVSFNTVLQPRVIIDGIIDIGAYEFQGTTGLDEIDSKSKISIFPNPFTSKIEISITTEGHHDVSIYIFDALGQNMFKENIFKENMFQENMFSSSRKLEVDLTPYPPGIYFVVCYLDGRQFTRIIAKQTVYHE
ncbi:MAG: T9SS type A sorting domain-containing protein [Saprospiraceae bacterium]|uniref:T9SS type A sorting domain-containing protein n=1 Tax=Candidatus Opimibacter skivensis TaxID=2982028 RepID=A0A9D7SXC8_9BACT|nr:T9SS type A sorting domain-containing protein [Candidatus Opimibacter skivensis]